MVQANIGKVKHFFFYATFVHTLMKCLLLEFLLISELVHSLFCYHPVHLCALVRLANQWHGGQNACVCV